MVWDVILVLVPTQFIFHCNKLHGVGGRGEGGEVAMVVELDQLTLFAGVI